MAYTTSANILTDLSVGAATEHTVLDTEQVSVDVSRVDGVTVSAKITGANASANGEVAFNLIGYNGDDWDTVPFREISVGMDGTNGVVQSFGVDVEAYERIKLLTVKNNDPDYDATVNYVKVLSKA